MLSNFYESDPSQVFKNAAISVDGEGLTGIYYPMAALPKEVERQLTR